jgi:ribokinase
MTAPPTPARGTVVVVGSINYDLTIRVKTLPRAGETVLGHDLTSGLGGKGANQAVAARRAGVDTVLVGAVGDDGAGSAALDTLDSRGVDTRHVRRIAGRPTGTALIVVEHAGENQIAVDPGANAALEDRVVRGALLSVPGQRVVVLCSLEISDAAVSAAAQTALERGWRLIINPAPFRPLPAQVLAAGPILTPNQGEAGSLLGDGATFDWRGAVTKRGKGTLPFLGGSPVVVTLGLAGAVVTSGRAWRHVPAPRVEVVDTTGAGDVFNGVLAATLARGEALETAVEVAVVAGSLATTARGASSAAPDWEAIASVLAGHRHGR